MLNPIIYLFIIIKDRLSQNFNNPRQFWNQLNCILNKNNGNVISQIQINNEIISDPLLISQALINILLLSVVSNTLIHSVLLFLQTLLHLVVYFPSIKSCLLMFFICQLKESTSAGPDGLETKFAKLAAHIIVYPLADLFNLSLSICSVPQIWKCATVTPLFKGGDSSDVNDYRPISIICAIAKIFEKLIFNQLSHHINLFDILFPFQSGFK